MHLMGFPGGVNEMGGSSAQSRLDVSGVVKGEQARSRKCETAESWEAESWEAGGLVI